MIFILKLTREFSGALPIDGKLVEMTPLPYRLRSSVISRIKIMAKLDISERRLPQDGRLKIKMGLKTIDIRVSTTPTILGKVVMRILMLPT